MGKSQLTLSVLKKEATQFADILTENTNPLLFGVTDGKALGSYFEQRFRSYLRERYHFVEGNSATGIDFPDLNVDIKLTSIKQPQSSCPYRSAREKVYGLDYSLLIFVYEKVDVDKVGRLNIISVIFVNKERTGDYQTTSGLLEILKNRRNKGDILTFFEKRRLPLNDSEASQLAEEVLQNPPQLGYLTISNALQWRLQFGRLIDLAGTLPEIERLK